MESKRVLDRHVFVKRSAEGTTYLSKHQCEELRLFAEPSEVLLCTEEEGYQYKMIALDMERWLSVAWCVPIACRRCRPVPRSSGIPWRGLLIDMKDQC